ncbi:hypothetical protein B0H67DRAFT_642014 [Lasiosphaeris hirsuta]|uniref:Uncharacterized protein n=1 Tax=Lasiosphaeris hirsuta TaxID=260670 RepID=A0AA40B165_9PEZI|nr:hypothetical protein B0H67DRAFT_642014 [Lasiosphaeris hirsuta]
MDFCLIVTIVVLFGLSGRRNGFISVGYALSAYGDTWRLSLLWTALPSLVFTCLGLHWSAIESAASDRQPFVGLSQPNGRPARETILLDYKAIIPVKRSYVAFRNGHWLLGTAQLAALSFSILSPLASGLFLASLASFQLQVPIAYTGTFDQARMNSSMDMRTVLDSVTAKLIYNAASIPWTDSERAFGPFRALNDGEGGVTSTNVTSLTAPTVAHSAYLNCAVLRPGSQFDLTRPSSSTQSTAARVTMSGLDRGCPVRHEFTVAEEQDVYFVTSAEISCGVKASYSRLVFTYGHFSSSSPVLLANVSVVSCAVGYRSTMGDLAATVPPPGVGGSSQGTASGSSPPVEFLTFTPTEDPRDSRDDAFGFWRLFELKLFQSQAFTADTTWATTDFGTVTLYRALQRQGGGATSTDNGTVLQGDVLAESISDVFTSVYSTSMATTGFVLQASDQQHRGMATLETELTRLYVVPWVAGTLVVALVFLSALAGLVLRHVRTHGTLLYEEPAGLLAQAGLLEDSEIIKAARAVRDAEGFNGQVVATVFRNHANNGGLGHDVVDQNWEMYLTQAMRSRISIARVGGAGR